MNQKVESKNEEEVRESYLPDAAIEQDEDDILGWGKFADRIAKALEDNKSHHGFVIGIQAKWGLGKSSLLNLVEKRLKKEDKEISVLRYNPWLFPDTDHVSFFFLELEKVAKYEIGKKALARLLRKFGNYIKKTETFSRGVMELVFIFSAIAGIVALSLEWSKWLTLIFFVFLILSTFSGALQKIFSALSSTVADKKTLSELKKELNCHLKKLKSQIIVLIDDIDRLPPHEICEIFQIVKNNGDLSNISYVLAYDKNVVRDVLVKAYNSEAYQNFPDKIVQIEFDIPPPHKKKLRDFLLVGLQKVLDESIGKTADKYWDERRWSNYYDSYLQNMFSSLREAKRILNVIRFNIHHIIKHGGVEVNPIDFVSIEIIRIQYPRIYFFIRDNKSLFIQITKPTDLWGISDESKKAMYTQYKELIGKIEEEIERKNLDEFLGELFPYFKGISTKAEVFGSE